MLTVPVDAWPLPPDLCTRLAPAPAICGITPVIGLWSPTFLPTLLAAVQAGERRMRALAQLAGARSVALPPHTNINFLTDLRSSHAGP